MYIPIQHPPSPSRYQKNPTCFLHPPPPNPNVPPLLPHQPKSHQSHQSAHPPKQRPSPTTNQTTPSPPPHPPLHQPSIHPVPKNPHLPAPSQLSFFSFFLSFSTGVQYRTYSHACHHFPKARERERQGKSIFSQSIGARKRHFQPGPGLANPAINTPVFFLTPVLFDLT